MMGKFIFTIILQIIFELSFIHACFGQMNIVTPDSIVNKKRSIRIMFYNVENLFDFYDDSLKNDDEFTPDKGKFWTPRKYYTKLNHISQVVAAIGGWNPPEIIGLCEIENRKVLDDLVQHSPLKKLNYRIIHKESPDHRGIDVAFLYLKNKFTPLGYKAIRLYFPFSPNSTTRDILYVKGVVDKKDTLHIFVNHWPSRWGGQLETERKRMYVASVLKKQCDSIFSLDKKVKIIIMGDFNDYPQNKSLHEILNARNAYNNIHPDYLYNLSAYLQTSKHIGSHKHESKWGTLDQFIVSGALLERNSGLNTSLQDVHIFRAKFLLEKDNNYGGFITNRTYIGFKYHEGYSDHLPVFLDLHKM